MNPARVSNFIEAYAAGLLAAIQADPKGYPLTSATDTAEDKAVRVALQTNEFIESGRFGLLFTESDGFRRTCAALKIPHRGDAILAYLEGGAA